MPPDRVAASALRAEAAGRFLCDRATAETHPNSTYLAVMSRNAPTVQAEIVGTPSYMSP